MSLIAILLALLIERHLGSHEELRRFRWFEAYSTRLRRLLPSSGSWAPSVAVVAILLPPVAAVALAGEFLAEGFLPLAFVFGLLVLLSCLGPRDLEAEVEAYLEASEKGDRESACWYAADLLGREPPKEPGECASALSQAIFIAAHERVLGVLFWFALLGPTGALLYRLSRELVEQHRDEAFAEAAQRLQAILSWLPARLTALTFALAGSFVETMHRWREEAARWADQNRGVLVSAGMGALGFRDAALGEADALARAREALGLVKRVLLIWLTALALLTIAGWLG